MKRPASSSITQIQVCTRGDDKREMLGAIGLFVAARQQGDRAIIERVIGDGSAAHSEWPSADTSGV